MLKRITVVDYHSLVFVCGTLQQDIKEKFIEVTIRVAEGIGEIITPGAPGSETSSESI